MTDSRASLPTAKPRPRGRPRRDPADAQARQALIRSGLAHLTEKGYSATGVDEILAHAQVPKGSFYHYFQNKETFGQALIEAYHSYFVTLLDSAFGDTTISPLGRMRALTTRAEAGMARHNFRRGCLIGNLGQEMGALPESFRAHLQAVLEDWQSRTAACLEAAKEAGELPKTADCVALAEFFWTGWEGAVLRAKLNRNATPLRRFAQIYFTLLATERPDR